MSALQSQRTLDLGVCVGIYRVEYNFAPGKSPFSAIPVRVTVEYNGTIVIDTGFCGDPSYSSPTIPVVSNNGKGTASFNKLSSSPSTAIITVYSPLPGSEWEFKLNCPLCSTPTPTPTPTLTPTLTPTPTTNDSNPGLTPTPVLETPTPTPNPTPTPEVTPTPTSTPVPAACKTCEQDSNCCCDAVAGQSLDFPFIIKNKPNADNPTADCCACGPTIGGDVHIGWSGRYTANYPRYTVNHILVDDNHLYDVEINPEEDDLLFDHYAIEWVEISSSGNINAILTGRVQLCRWPGTTICNRIIKIGNPLGASIDFKKSKIPTTQCGNCTIGTDWYRYTINLKPNNFQNLLGYGGIHWEYMKWLRDISDTVGPEGYTGPIGKNSSFWPSNKFRIRGNSINSAIVGDDGNSLLTRESPYFVYEKVNQLSNKIKNWIDNQQQNITSQYLMRESIYNSLNYNGGSSDPCCTANDMDFEENCEDDSTTPPPGPEECPDGFNKIGVDSSGIPICCPTNEGCDNSGECVSCDSL